MPTRGVAIAILVLWAVVASDLVRRDVMPGWVLGPPPDFRAIVADASDAPTRWTIRAAEKGERTAHRPVGEVVTQTLRRRDGSARLTSIAWFDSASMLRGTPLEAVGDSRLEVLGGCEVDSAGNLDSFRVTVREGQAAKTDLMVIDGHLKNDTIEVVTQSPLPILSWSKSFPYRSRGLVQSTMAPLDRLPNLHLGQRWESRVVSPLTGRVETGTVEVVARRHITWNSEVIATLELVTKMGPLSARTWVRGDGMVVRQEVPFPFVRLVLERVADESASGN